MDDDVPLPLIFIDVVMAMVRMVFEVFMVLAIVIGITFMMKVTALENKQIDRDDDDSGENNL